MQSWVLAQLARLYLLTEEVTEAQATLQKSKMGVNPEFSLFLELIFVPLAEGEVALAQDDYERAITIMGDLIVRLQTIGM